MKKILTFILFLSITLDANAIRLSDYYSPQPQQINGSIKTNGSTDIITIKGKQQSFQDISNEFFKFNNQGYDIGNLLLSIEQKRWSEQQAERNKTADPYVIPIDCEEYIMIVENNPTQWTPRDLLGIEDKKTEIFTSLKLLDCDNNIATLTADELKKKKIRLVKIDKNGKLLLNNKSQDFELNKISHIDMLKLRITSNAKDTGIFGHFNVYLNTEEHSKKMIVGYVTFHTEDELKRLFSN